MLLILVIDFSILTRDAVMLKKLFSTTVCFTFSANLFAAGGLCENLTLKQAYTAESILSQSDKMVTCDNYDSHDGRPCTYGSWHIAGNAAGEVQDRGNNVYGIVAFGTDLLDLASVWVKTGSSNYTNLATLVGCKKVGNTPNLKLEGEKFKLSSFNLKNKLTCVSADGKKKIKLAFQPDGLNYLQNEKKPTLATAHISGKVVIGVINIMGDGQVVPFPMVGDEAFIGANALRPYQDETGASAIRGFLFKMIEEQEEPQETTSMTCR